jgi:hypothetical protein
MIEGVSIKQNKQGKLTEAVRASSISLRLLKSSAGKALDAALTKLIADQKEEIILQLKNKMSMSRPARERSGNLFGRFINKINADNGQYIEIDGVVFLAILKYLGEIIEVSKDTKHIYLVPFDEVETIVLRLQC